MKDQLRPIGTEFEENWSYRNITASSGRYRNVKVKYRVIAHVLSARFPEDKVGRLAEEIKTISHEENGSNMPLYAIKKTE